MSSKKDNLTFTCSKCTGSEDVRLQPDGSEHQFLCRACRGEPTPPKKIEIKKRTDRDINISAARDILNDYAIQSFPDETGQPWIQYLDDGKKRFHAVESTTFRDYIRVMLNYMTDAPRGSWVEELLQLFASEARRQPQRTLYVRSASIEKTWFFQLSEDETLIIKDGKIKKVESLPLFRNFAHQAPIVVDLDAKPEDLNLIEKYLRFATGWELELYKSTLPAYAIPGIAKPIELARGPPGAAKSTLNRVKKEILDPCTTLYKGSEFPKDEGDWFVRCRGHALILLDNLNRLSKEQQDECCRVITGKNVERRKLYTDADVIAATIQGTLLINAIDLSNLNSDFIDRALIWDLGRVEDNERIPEERFWKDFRRDLPKIRGAMFKILAKAQTIIDKTPSPDHLRLADFAHYAAACAAARGRKPEEFGEQLKLKAELQKDESISQSPLAEPIERFMENRDFWEGSASDLLKELTAQEYGVVVGEGVHERTEVRNVPREWIKTSSILMREFNRITHLLPRMGIYSQTRRTKRGSRISLGKSEKMPSHPSPIAPDGSRTLNSWSSEVQASENEPSPTRHHASPRVTGDGKVTRCSEEAVTQESGSEPRIVEERIEGDDGDD